MSINEDSRVPENLLRLFTKIYEAHDCFQIFTKISQLPYQSKKKREKNFLFPTMGLMHITSQFFSSSAAYCMKSRLGGIA